MTFPASIILHGDRKYPQIVGRQRGPSLVWVTSEEISPGPGARAAGRNPIPQLSPRSLPCVSYQNTGRRERSSWRLAGSPLGHSCCSSQGKSKPWLGAAQKPLPCLPLCGENPCPQPPGILVLAQRPAQRNPLPSWGWEGSGGQGGLGEPPGLLCGPVQALSPGTQQKSCLLHCGNSHRPEALGRG